MKEVSKTNISGSKKATGLGVTEFMLRIMAWLCTRDETFVGSQMCIVTGPNIEMATKLIKTYEGYFRTKVRSLFPEQRNGFRIEWMY